MVQFHEEKQSQRIKELHSKEEEDLARYLSKKYGVPYIDLAGIAIDPDALRLIDQSVAEDVEVAAFNLTGKELYVAARTPGSDDVGQILDDLREKKYLPKLFIASHKSLRKAWDRYGDISFATETKAGLVEISDKNIEEFISKIRSVEEVGEVIKKGLLDKKSHRVSRVVEIILAGAMALRASDVHIEPEEETVRIRMRIDGVLTPVIAVERDVYKLLVSRIKLLSGLKLNITNDAQDGRFSITIGENDIEIRTSVIPGAYGESIVMRVLDPRTIGVPIEELGMDDRMFEVLTEELKKPNGMILNTGPTGSGKTTSLYAFLKKIHRPGIKIITIENPIEYHLPGIVQTQVNEGEEYTFNQGLVSALRQDPDVIMVGEIRSSDTATTAVQAALTGHLVFSTLHTNNAAGTFPRLLDLGVNPSVFGAAINISMAQRLVRVLCPHCKKEVALEGRDKKIIDEIVATIHDPSMYEDVLPPTSIWKATGCEECGGIGYRGRIGIFEAIVVNDKIDDLIRKNPSEHEIQEASRDSGILNLRQDGIIKVLRGVTDIEELGRIIDLSFL